MSQHAQLTAREIHGPYMQLLTNLQGDGGREWLVALNRFLRKENPWEKTVSKLLKSIASVHVSGYRRFVVRNHLKVNTSEKAKVKIAWLGENLNTNFLDLVEEGGGNENLNVNRLLAGSLDQPIIEELGNKAEIKLCQFFALLRKQSKGQNGVLLVNGYANIAYIRDAKGELWAVGACWFSDFAGWDVEAYSVSNPFRWGAGGQVVSR